MKCKEVRRLLKDGGNAGNAEGIEIRAHLSICEECRGMIAVERLTAVLIKSYASQPDNPSDISPFLMNRIRMRIQEMGDHGVGTLEHALLTLRGWVYAFGVAAVLLLSLSFQMRPNTAQANLTDQDSDLATQSIIGDDFIGNKDNLERSSSETATLISQHSRDPRLVARFAGRLANGRK